MNHRDWDKEEKEKKIRWKDHAYLVSLMWSSFGEEDIKI